MTARYAKRINSKHKSAIRYEKIDFTPSEINRTIKRRSYKRPTVTFPFFVAAGTGIAAFITGLPILSNIAMVAVSIGVASWFYSRFIKHDDNVQKYVNQMQAVLSEQVHESVLQLEDKLKQLRARSALKQLDRLKEKFNAFTSILNEKFDPGELTYGRYLGMTEQVFLAGMDNLKSIADIKRSTSTINERQTERRTKELQRKDTLSSAEKNELKALEERQTLLDSQSEKVEELLSQNELAIMEIEKVMAAIAELNTGNDDSQAKMDIEDAMAELTQLAERAKDYNI